MNVSLKHLAPVALGIATAVVIASPANAAPVASSAPVHFATPQAAMRYLADAVNHHDVTALHHVTTPASYKELNGMLPEMHKLRLQSCKSTGHGDYLCTFTYQYRNGSHWENDGQAQVIAAPAIRPGWYMYELLSCGG